jgi:hypothetical protein
VKTRAWTEEEIDKLKVLAASGASALRVAAVLNRAVAAVKQKARNLNIPFPAEHQLRAKRRQIFQNSTDAASHNRAPRRFSEE